MALAVWAQTEPAETCQRCWRAGGQVPRRGDHQATRTTMDLLRAEAQLNGDDP